MHHKLDREYIFGNFDGTKESMYRIAEDLECTYDVVRRILLAEGIIQRQRHRPDPEKMAEADRLLDGTITYGEVAATVGMKRDTLVRNMPNRGLRPEFVGTMRAARKLEEELGL